MSGLTMGATLGILFIFVFQSFNCSLSGLYDSAVMSRCCKHILAADDQLNSISCVNATVSRLLAQCPLPIFPRLSIVIVTRATEHVFQYSAYSYFIQAAYAEMNNYHLVPLWEDTRREDYAYHRKLVPILEVLQSQAFYADYVAWVDAGKDTISS